MAASSTLLTLLTTLVVCSSTEDYVCGDNNQAKTGLRGGSLNYGDNTNPLENPWLVQLVYADKTRACAGSLITVSHVLTARQCVDGVKPEDISVIYGPRTPYGGNASVKSAKLPSDADADLAVLELAFAVEISDSTVPVCVADTFDKKVYPEYKGLHFGPKNKSEDNELARAMYQDVLWRVDEKECIKALGDDYDKDAQFCVGKRNQVFAEGVYTGGPILMHHRGRYLQVGIALKADAENNYGSATRVPLYQKVIGELTGCFLTVAGLNSTTSSKPDCKNVSKTTSTTKRTTKPTTKRTTKRTTASATTPNNKVHKITEENINDLGYKGIVEFGNGDDNSPRIHLTTANKDKTMGLAIRLTEEADGLLRFNVEYGINPECLNKTTAQFHFGEQYGYWSPDSPYFRVLVMLGSGDIVVPKDLKEDLRIMVDPNSGQLTVICGGEHGRTSGAIVSSLKSEGKTFYTPQFYLKEWTETKGCKTPKAHQFVNIILRNAELWTPGL